jgi:hypothetical protein
LIYALIFQAKPFDASWLKFLGFHESLAERINFAFGAIGSLLLVYGILLILGAAFTVRALATVYVLDARAEQTPPREPSTPDQSGQRERDGKPRRRLSS